MKILIIGAYFPRPNNPIMGSWALSQALALQSLGNEVQVISPLPAIPAIVGRLLRREAACPARYRWDGMHTEVHYARWPMFPVGPLAQLTRDNLGFFAKFAWSLAGRRFMKIGAAFAPDVIFAHQVQVGGFIGSQMARKLGVPLFVCEHSFEEIEWCSTSAHRRNFYLQVLKRVDAWIAVSHRMAASMRRILPSVPQLTVHNGAEFIPARLQNIARPAMLAGKLVVLCVALFYKRKNIPLLIRSFDRIAAKHPDAVLVIGGDGDDMPAVTAAHSAALHRNQILLLGRLSHLEALQYMVWCDVFALVSIDEAFGVVFAEALMAAKPIIFCSDAGIGDLAINEVHGLSVLPGDEQSPAAALNRLLGDTALRNRLGSAAAKLAHTELTWDINARRLTRIFAAATGSIATP